jgi:competence protein ComEA
MQSARPNISPPGALLIGAVMMGVAVVMSLMIVTRAKDGDVLIISDPSQFEIVVEVRGAVRSPGVYRLPEDARLDDLLNAAGGITEGADLTTQNLARRLADSEVVIIGRLNLATPVVAIQDDLSENPQLVSFKIDINTASRAELESLPGIGPVIAQRIIDYRSSHGRFSSVTDLTQVEGVSDHLVTEIQNLITVGP